MALDRPPGADLEPFPWFGRADERATSDPGERGDAQFYRERAAWWRGFAERAGSAALRQSRLDLAAFFERRAGEVERG